MASESEIRFNYEQALKKVQELEEIAGELKQIAAGELDGALTKLGGSWQSEASGVYRKKGEDLGERVGKRAENILEIADAARKMAKRLYEAEMAAYRLAQIRNYDH